MRDRVIIHHLSDIHFGVYGVALERDTRSLAPIAGVSLTEQYIQHLESLHSSTSEKLPDLVIVSGDLASIGSPSELKQAADFCNRIADIIQSPSRRNGKNKACSRIVVVPGNHDVDWSIAWKEELDELRLVGFQKHFSRFQIPHKQTENGEKSLYINDDLGVLVYAINSSHLSGINDPQLQDLIDKIQKKVSDNDLHDISPLLKEAMRIDPGFIREKDVTSFENEYRNLERKHGPNIHSYAKLAVLHHPISLFSREQSQKYPVAINGGILKHILQEKGFDLVLHGHLHQAQVLFEDLLPRQLQQGLHIIAAGSLSGKNGAGNSFNRIEIRRRNGGEFTCRVDKISSSEPAHRFNTSDTIGCLYRHDEEVEKLPNTFYQAANQIALNQKEKASQKNIFESLKRDLKRLNKRTTNTGYTNEWMNAQPYLRALTHSQRIYATDIQATNAWTTPIVYQYFLLQVKHLLGQRANADRPPYVVSEHVFDAIQHAARNSEEKKSVFSRDSKIVRSGDPPVEIARILIWDKEELHYPEVEAIFQLHESCGIPLFFLDAKETDRDAFSKFEYVIFSGREMLKQHINGSYYNPIDWPQEDYKDKYIVNGMIYAQDHELDVLDEFHNLLRRDNILLAQDALAKYKKTHGRSIR